MLILYTTATQSCSTIREVMTAVLYCKHLSYSPGRASVTPEKIGLYFCRTLAKARHPVTTSVLTSKCCWERIQTCYLWVEKQTCYSVDHGDSWFNWQLISVYKHITALFLLACFQSLPAVPGYIFPSVTLLNHICSSLYSQRKHLFRITSPSLT